jgi:hypothetical protein
MLRSMKDTSSRRAWAGSLALALAKAASVTVLLVGFVTSQKSGNRRVKTGDLL